MSKYLFNNNLSNAKSSTKKINKKKNKLMAQPNLELIHANIESVHRKRMRDVYSCLENKIKSELTNEANRILEQKNRNEPDGLNIFESEQHDEQHNQQECGICYDTLTDKNIHTNQCGHSFCVNCIRDHITISINNNNLDITCPSTSCQSIYDIGEIYKIVGYDTFEKYKNFLVIKHNGMVKKKLKIVRCIKCNSGIMKNNKNNNVVCYECGYKFCFDCQIKHTGISCKKYIKWKNKNKNRDKYFKKYLKNMIFKKCPECKILINKKGGCNHVTCENCGVGFFWSDRKKIKKIKSLDL